MSRTEIPQTTLAGAEPRAVGDALLRDGAKLARDGKEVVVTGNALAREVAENPEQFSSGVSRFLQLPNGLDGEKHTEMRALIDRYLAAEEVDQLAPMFHKICLLYTSPSPRSGVPQDRAPVG